jgi:hypothetical protein
VICAAVPAKIESAPIIMGRIKRRVIALSLAPELQPVLRSCRITVARTGMWAKKVRKQGARAIGRLACGYSAAARAASTTAWASSALSKMCGCRPRLFSASCILRRMKELVE